jgi:hypothetical protein
VSHLQLSAPAGPLSNPRCSLEVTAAAEATGDAAPDIPPAAHSTGRSARHRLHNAGRRHPRTALQSTAITSACPPSAAARTCTHLPSPTAWRAGRRGPAPHAPCAPALGCGAWAHAAAPAPPSWAKHTLHLFHSDAKRVVDTIYRDDKLIMGRESYCHKVMGRPPMHLRPTLPRLAARPGALDDALVDAALAAHAPRACRPR